MYAFPLTIVLRHRKENLKKCSLKGLENRKDFRFFLYPCDSLPPLDNYLSLGLEGSILSKQDQGKGIFLVDGTWRYAKTMSRTLPCIERRSLPHDLRTSYPRKKTGCQDPERGLASIEALYVAYLLLGRDTQALLDHYYWKNAFLQTNRARIKSIQTRSFG